MKHVCMMLLALCGLMSHGQKKLPFVDYESILTSVSESAEKEDYDEVLKQLYRIHKNDSTYCSVLTTKSYYYILQEKYDKALATTNEGLEMNCEGGSKLFLLINKGVSYSNSENYEEALKVYETALKLYPRNAKLWFNKAIALENLNNFPAAIEAYQNTILYNPLHRNAHVRLGNVCYRQQLMSQALMCYNMALLIEPDTERAFALLKYVNDVVADKNESESVPNLVVSPDDEAFEDIDLILNNRIALNANYPIETQIPIPLVKQNHVLLQQLQSFEGDNGFWDKYYVPFYNWIHANNYFEDFTYTVNYAVKNEAYKKIIEKNEDKVLGFIKSYSEKWFEILSENVRENMAHHYSEGNLLAEGPRNGDVYVGDWTFYDANGRLSSTGFFNEKGERQNTWTWFHENGAIKEIATYKDGKLNGENRLFYDDGSPYVLTTLLDDEFEGEYKYYLETGGLKQKKFYSNGKLDGRYLAYFDVGEDLLEYDTNYKEGEISGDLIEYYADGKIFSVVNFKNDKRHGKEIQYYWNGNKSLDADYSEGDLQGAYITYHSNGKIKDIGQADKGYFNGPWKSYFYDGTLNAEYTYNEGDFEGGYKTYDVDGVLLSDFQYKKGDIISYKFYDKSGKTFSEGSKKEGEFFYEGYYANGNKSSEGKYDVSGGKTGHWKFYGQNGTLSSDGEFQNNEPIGVHTTYHKSGKIMSISDYNIENGSTYYQYFYLNGQLQNQGWYKDGLEHGEWHFYYIDGTLEATRFYHKGDLHGLQKNFKVDGTIESHTVYNFGRPIEESYFNTHNEQYESFKFKDAEKTHKLVTHYQNGNIQSEIPYVNGVQHGPYKFYDFYGAVVVSGNYNNGNQHGEWNWYYDDGKLRVSEVYLNGSRNGASKRYYQSGQLEDDYFYENGSKAGTWLSYHENGKLFTSTEYVNNMVEGRKELFSPSGNLQIVRFYKNDVLFGYTYLNADGTEKEMIPIKNETAQLKAFYDNGKPSRTMTFINGEVHGDYKAYYYNGQLEHHSIYDHGEYNGLDIDYYEDGAIKSRENTLYGLRNGISEQFYENGKLMQSVNYLNNEKHGEAKYYSETGKLTKTEYYANGLIYDSKS